MSFYNIVFSPTGGCKKVADIMMGVFDENNNYIDLTDRTVDFSKYSFSANDVCMITVPSYGGRVPQIACDRIAMLSGNGARAILVAVYGNRAFEDTLWELKDVCKAAGFYSIAAVSAIAKHSIVTDIASERPDKDDVAILTGYARAILGQLNSNNISEVDIETFSDEYKTRNKNTLFPKVNDDCINCGKCFEKCPVGAIDKTNPTLIDEEKCIGCMRCVNICSRNARYIEDSLKEAIKNKIKPFCEKYKAPDIY